jgi:hypothetical protein
MGQLHKSFTDEQIKVLLQTYCQGKMRRADIQEILSAYSDDVGRQFQAMAITHSSRCRPLIPVHVDHPVKAKRHWKTNHILNQPVKAMVSVFFS